MSRSDGISVLCINSDSKSLRDIQALQQKRAELALRSNTPFDLNEIMIAPGQTGRSICRLVLA